MNTIFKRMTVLLMLCAMLLCCLAACNPDPNKPNETTPSTGAPITGKPQIDEPVTLNILTVRHPETSSDADDLWFFKYMEYWFAQQGYDVTIKVQQTAEAAQQTSLLLGTDSLPDIMWAINISRTDIMEYGVEQDMLLNWAPYLNESLMPNLTARFAELPEVKEAATAPNGGIYALPYLTPAQLASGCYGTSERLYFRQSWLDQVGMENPTTEEELLEVLRAFKNVKTESGRDPIPVVSAASFLERYLWTCLGFYGTEPAKYGSTPMIKDGELVVPAYTEDYRHFITLMHTMYTEGLLATDYFSMSDATAGGLMRDNVCGALAWWTLEYVGDDFSDIVCANPILLGDNDSIHVTRLNYYTSNRLWASADTKYPELVAMLMDFVYSDEGAFLYRYGPKAGEDPLNLVEGWYYDENGEVTTDLVENGTYTSMSAYGRDRLFPHDSAGLRPAIVTTGTGENIEFTDSVTGKTFTCLDNYLIDDNTNDGHWRLITMEKWSGKATSVRLPGTYLSSDDSATVSDLSTVLNNYITTESARFITGQRDLSEIDDFWAELKNLGMEDYLKIHRDAYADFMEVTFGK